MRISDCIWLIDVCWQKCLVYWGVYQDKFVGVIIYVKKARFECDHMIHIYSIPSQSLLPSPLKPNETLNVCAYCVCADLTSLAYMV